MNKQELKSKIQKLAKQVYAKKVKAEDAAVAYDELTKFPELKGIIVDLLTTDFDKFLESIDWVAPRPSTFRVNLLNGENFLLIYGTRSWQAKVKGKKYYLLNLSEEEMAAKAISRILALGGKVKKDIDELDVDSSSGGSSSSSSSRSSSGGGSSDFDFDEVTDEDEEDNEIDDLDL